MTYQLTRLDWVLLAESIPMHGFVDLKTTVKGFLADAEKAAEAAEKRVEALQEKMKEAEDIYKAAWEPLHKMHMVPTILRPKSLVDEIVKVETEIRILGNNFVSAKEKVKWAADTRDSAAHHLKVLRAANEQLGN